MASESLLEKYRRRQEENSRRSGGQDIWANIEDGDNFFRILQSDKEGGFYVEALYHNNLKLIGVPQEKGKGCYCRKSFDRKAKCPICDFVDSLLKSEDPKEVEVGKKVRAKKKLCAWVFKLKSPQDVEPEDDKPRIMTFGQTVESQLLTYFLDPDYGDFTDPKTGRNITITRTGKDLNTEYSVRPRPKTSAFSFQWDKNGPPSIPDAIPPRSYNDMCEMLGQEPEEGADETPAPPPAKTPPAPPKAQPPKPAPKATPPPEPEENEGGEDDTPPPPPPKKPPVATTVKKPAPAPKPAPEPETPPEETEGGDTGKPACYGDGETFNPRSDECKACPHMKPCKDIFLGIG